MEITKTEFEAYVSVQESGITNMFMVKTVSALSGLSKGKIFKIMKEYSALKEKFSKVKA